MLFGYLAVCARGVHVAVTMEGDPPPASASRRNGNGSSRNSNSKPPASGSGEGQSWSFLWRAIPQSLSRLFTECPCDSRFPVCCPTTSANGFETYRSNSQDILREGAPSITPRRTPRTHLNIGPDFARIDPPAQLDFAQAAAPDMQATQFHAGHLDPTVPDESVSSCFGSRKARKSRVITTMVTDCADRYNCRVRVQDDRPDPWPPRSSLSPEVSPRQELPTFGKKYHSPTLTKALLREQQQHEQQLVENETPTKRVEAWLERHPGPKELVPVRFDGDPYVSYM